MAVRAFQFLDDIGALFQPCDCEGAIFRGLIFANDRPLCAGSLAAEVAQLETSPLQRGSRPAVVFVDHQCRQGCVVHDQLFAGTGLQIELVNTIILDGESRRTLLLDDLVPAPIDIG